MMTRRRPDLHAQFEGPSQPDITPSSSDKKGPSFRKEIFEEEKNLFSSSTCMLSK